MTTATAPAVPKVKGFRTPKSALRAVAQVVKGHEDFVYRPIGGACTYTVRDEDTQELKSSCLIGKALHEVGGVPLDFLRLVDFGGDVGAENTALKLGLPTRVAKLLQAIQTAQDGGNKWSVVLEVGQQYAEMGV